MRVIAGSARGRPLESVPGDSTRPITDRTKEALFSIIGPAISGTRFLDLFGGTGAVGIEALSRGAARAVFVERDRLALRTIGHNLQSTGLADGAQVVRGNAFKFLDRPGEEQFEFVYIAPPQYKEIWIKALQAVDRSPIVVEEGYVIVQIHPREHQDVELETLRLVDERRYGSTLLMFFLRNSQTTEEVDAG